MVFSYPFILWGLFAMSIPVIIHLFNFRRHKRVYFTNVKHIQELKLQTQRQSKLRHLLVMLARMITIACLVLAFSQPYIPVSDVGASDQSGNAVSIYIDNSFSMEAEATNGALIDLVKRQAGEIARAHRSSDMFQLLTNDFEPGHQRLVSLEEFLEMIEDVDLTPRVQTLSLVLQRQKELLSFTDARNKSRFILSDFQRSIVDIEQADDDTLISTFLVPSNSGSTGNLYIDSCWFESPVHQLGQGVKLKVRVKNASDENYEKIPVKLTVNGVQRALASFDIKSATSAIIEMPYTNNEAGIQYGTLQITDYPVTFDDALHLVYIVQPAIPVLSIFGEQPSVFLNSLLGSDSAFAYQQVSHKSISYDELPSYFFIILDGLKEISSGLGQALADFCQNGGSLLIIPAEEMDLSSYRTFLDNMGKGSYRELIDTESQVSFLDMEHPVFLDVFEGGRLSGRDQDAPVDLPKVKSYYSIDPARDSYRMPLMRLLNRAEFLTVEPAGSGYVYMLTVPLEDRFSNFQRHALFVPVIYRMAFLSGATSPLFHTIGSSNSITLDNTKMKGDNVLKIEKVEGAFELIPGQHSSGSSLNLLMYDQIRSAGHYRVRSDDDILAGLAFNFDRRESDLSLYSTDQLKDLIKDEELERFTLLSDNIQPIRDTIQDLNQGKRLWKLFIILALFFMALEVFLLRLWSKY
jgi:hypothetical protein